MVMDKFRIRFARPVDSPNLGAYVRKIGSKRENWRANSRYVRLLCKHERESGRMYARTDTRIDSSEEGRTRERRRMHACLLDKLSRNACQRRSNHDVPLSN